MSTITWFVLLVGMSAVGTGIGYLLANRIDTCPPPGVCAQCPSWSNPQCPTRVTADALKSDAGDPNYYICAVRDGGCVAPVGTPIYYGVGGKYVKREAALNVTPCSVASFGEDPVPGQDKACWVPRSYPSVPESLENDPRFYKCANDGDACVVPKDTPIFFGGRGTYTSRMAPTDSTLCTASQFGTDAGPGQACYVPK